MHASEGQPMPAPNHEYKQFKYRELCRARKVANFLRTAMGKHQDAGQPSEIRWLIFEFFAACMIAAPGQDQKLAQPGFARLPR